MALTLYFHPLASYCHKVLVALYENETPFDTVQVDLGDEKQRADFKKVWPIAKFPVLHDSETGRTVNEANIIVDYLALHHPGKVALVPSDLDRAIAARGRHLFFDHYLIDPIGKIVTDKLRPTGKNDPVGVEEAKTLLRTAYDILENDTSIGPWAQGEDFTTADCAASPALFYADRVYPFANHPRLSAYLDRLKSRPSFARVLREAEPYLKLMPT